MSLVDQLEAISLRVHQIACTAGVMAASSEVEGDVSHALFLIEECLRHVEKRVEAAREDAIVATKVEAVATMIPLSSGRSQSSGSRSPEPRKARRRS